MDHYFKADVELIGKLIDKDCLRYTQNNEAILVTTFAIPDKQGKDHKIYVIIKAEQAEAFDKLSGSSQWFSIKGELSDHSPSHIEKEWSKITIIAGSLHSIPNASMGLINCTVIGRLTKDPESITKTNDFQFIRFSVAVNRLNKDKPTFLDFSVFKPSLMSQVQQDTKKGISIYALGELSFFYVGESRKQNYSIKLEKLRILADK